MKTASKIAGLMLALVMVVSLFATTVFATSSVPSTYSITYSVQITDAIPPIYR